MIAQADLARFKELLEQKRSFLILLPQNPDMDAVAAALSLYLALQAQDSQVDIACPTPMRVEFNRLVGVNKIKEHAGDRNLNISFENYDAAGIEKVSYDIDNGRFNLKVVPKQGYQAPQPSQVKLEYGRGNGEVVIVVKTEKRQDLGNFAEGEQLNAQVVLVSNLPCQGFPNPIEVIDPQAASASEVVFQILENWGWQLTQDLANNLLMGVSSGTNNFQSQNITADTFSVASRLMQSGARLQPSLATQPQQVGPVPAPQQTVSPTTQPAQTQSSQPPEDWLQPKVYKGSKLP